MSLRRLIVVLTVLDLRGFRVDKVYAVWQGIYSDRDVIAVFSTQALADAFCEEYDKLHGYYDTRVQVYELDNQVGYKAVKFWESHISYDTGEIINRHEGYTDKDISERYVSYKVDRSEVDYLGQLRISTSDEIMPDHIVVYSIESADHADKLAIEARQEYQRLINQGGIPTAPRCY